MTTKHPSPTKPVHPAPVPTPAPAPVPTPAPDAAVADAGKVKLGAFAPTLAPGKEL